MSWEEEDYSDPATWEGPPLNRYHARSHPGQISRRSLRQGEALKWMALLGGVVLLLVGLRLQQTSEVLIYALVASILVIGIAFAIAEVRLGQRWVEVGIRGEYFYLRSALDAAQPQPSRNWFPLAYAAPVQRGNQLQLTYHDRILNLQLSDFPEGDNLKYEFIAFQWARG